MKIDVNHTMDSIKEGTIEVAETAQAKTSEFHENYVSKVIPDLGKYGDAAKFVAEMAPGVSEYNAIREGDWQAFAIAAGLDVAAFAAGAVTAGAGFTAVKGGSTLAKAGAKKAVKEVAEAGAKKFAKEAAETGAEKLAKEAAEAGAEKVAKELVEAGTEKAAKEVTSNLAEKGVKEVKEVSQVVKNKWDGIAREEKVLADLIEKYGKDNVLREQFIRDKFGKIIKDPITNEARRIDFIVIAKDKVLRSIEVTSETAPKLLQTEKELRILKQAREMGGAFIKNIDTGELIEFSEKVVTEIMRL